jgi:NAD-dependent deacetylase
MYSKAAKIIKSAKRCTAFTGAGISVESGIPPFRGKNGLWNRYDPQIFDIHYFYNNSEHSWQVLRDIFYDLFGAVKPNAAHYVLAELEVNNMLNAVITQNVDNLHYDAGSKTVHEFHGSLKSVVCLKCRAKLKISQVDLNTLPPLCKRCNGILKPDIIFFGEAIPEPAQTNSFKEAKKSDCFILIGTTGMVAPANMIPKAAKENGAKIIEINPDKSEYTNSITDIFIEEKAACAMEILMEEIDKI